MFARYIKYIVTAILCCAFCALVEAAPSRATRLPANGLSNTINAIAQDSEGFIWIGTGAGVLRYDGYSYMDFRGIQDNPAVSQRIRCIVPDMQRGTIWIGTEDGAVVYDCNSDQFRCIKGGLSEESSVKTIIRTSGGDFLLCTASGMEIVDGETLEPQSLDSDFDAPFFRNRRRISSGVDGVFWSAYSDILVSMDFRQSRFSPEIHSWKAPEGVKVFHVDDSGRILYLDSNDNLSYCKAPSSDKEHFGVGSRLIASNIDVRGICRQGDDFVAVSSYGGVLRFGIGQSGEIAGLEQTWLDDTDHTSISNGVLCTMSDRNGNIYYGTANGLFVEWSNRAAGFRSILAGEDKGLLHSVVSDVISPDGRTAWLAVGNGIDEIDLEARPFKITHHQTDKNLADNTHSVRIQCLAMDKTGLMWAGTKTGILTFRPSSGKWERPAGLSKFLKQCGASFCKTVMLDSQNRVWFGFINGGVVVMNLSNGVVENLNPGGEEAGASNIYSICQDASGNIWVATKSKGIFRYGEGPDSTPSVFFRNNPPAVYDLYQTSRGEMLACTSDGLFSLPLTGEEEPARLSDSHTAFNELIEDDRGQLWLSSQAGISCMDEDRTSLSFSELNESSFSQLDYNTGSCKSADGRLFFGGVNGLTFFDPKDILGGTSAKTVHVSKATVMGMNVPVPAEGKLVIKPTDHHFSLSLSTLEFPANLALKYFYRVQELGDEWIPVDGNTLSFLNLAPGEYHIQMTTGDQLAAIDQEPAVMLIDVLKPWWKQWWAISLALLVLSAIGYAFIDYRLVKYRSDFQMRAFINVTHGMKKPLSLMKVPLSLLRKDVKSDNDMALVDMVDGNVNKLSHTINQLLELRKLSRRVYVDLHNVDISALVGSIAEVFAPSFESRGMTFDCCRPEEALPYVCDPDKIEMLVFNLVENAYNFTPDGGTVALALNRVGDDVLITVTDNGVGIDRKYHRKIFERFWQYRENGALPAKGSGIGLSVVEEFVKLHGGKVSVKSAVGAGAEFVVTLPLNKFKDPGTGVVEEVDPMYTRKFARNMTALPFVGEQGSARRCNVVSVSGDPEMAAMLSHVLARHDVTNIDNIDKAYEHISTTHPQLVVVDLDVDLRDECLALCRRVKQKFDLNDIPFIYLTDEDNPQEAKACYEIGADTQMAKPFDPGLFSARAEQLIGKLFDTREKIKIEKILASSQEIDIESADDKFLRAAMDLVESNIPNENFSLDEFSSAMNVSRTVLNSRLRSITGRTPMEIVKNARMQKAAQLLASGAYDVSQVSYQVGFSDSRYFATCFKKEFGCTPTSYINQSRS